MKHIFIFIFLATSTLLFSQKRNCGQPEHFKKLCEDKEYLAEFEKRTDFLNKSEPSKRTDTLYIPLAFHFQGTNAKRECLEDIVAQQVKILNDDFHGVGVGSERWENDKQFFPNTEIGKSRIKFVVANQNHPTGYGLTDGMNAITINKTTGDFDGNWKGVLNVFTFRIGSGILGYSPLSGRGNGDGFVLAPFAFGGNGWCGTDSLSVGQNNNFSFGRTATHEAGHFFSGYHIWGISEGCQFDDFVDDTPLQFQPNFDCDRSFPVTCESVDLCFSFLDYSRDTHMNIYSKGQTDRFDLYVERYLENVTSNYTNVVKQIETTPTDTIEIETPAVEEPTTETPTVKTWWEILWEAILALFS